MHIVFVIANNSSVPYFNWFAEKAAEQKEHTFTFIAMHAEKPKMIADVAKFGWNCHWVKFDHNKRKRGMIYSLFKLYSLFRNLKPDVVHTHLFDDSLPALLAARLANIKVRGIVKADTGFHYFYNRKWVIADKFNNWNATDIVPPSNEAKAFIQKHENADLKKITMIHHGIPYHVFTNQSEKFKSELIEKYNLEDKIVIGTVSRLIDWKGYRYIVEAAQKVVQLHPKAVFLFVGEGPQKEELESLIKAKKLKQNIILTGWMDRTYIPSFYGVLNVYVHAASFEPFGFVIAEAMMNGAPIVSTPTGSALDSIKHKENGYLVEYKNSNSLAEGIIYTIQQGDQFKEKEIETALKMFQFDTMYENYINLYKKRMRNEAINSQD